MLRNPRVNGNRSGTLMLMELYISDFYVPGGGCWCGRGWGAIVSDLIQLSIIVVRIVEYLNSSRLSCACPHWRAIKLSVANAC